MIQSILNLLNEKAMFKYKPYTNSETFDHEELLH